MSESRVQPVRMDFTRFLMDKIVWEDRMIGISGARGAGKTTLLLQYMKSRLPANLDVLYVSLDDIYFAENPLIYFAEDFHKRGGEYLFLDEVHKFPGWSRQLKNIYNSLPGLKVVFTSSSALDIYKGAYDLSRRAMVYNLPGLSFREYLDLKYRIKLPYFTLEQILFETKSVVPSILLSRKR